MKAAEVAKELQALTTPAEQIEKLTTQYSTETRERIAKRKFLNTNQISKSVIDGVKREMNDWLISVMAKIHLEGEMKLVTADQIISEMNLQVLDEKVDKRQERPRRKIEVTPEDIKFGMKASKRMPTA